VKGLANGQTCGVSLTASVAWRAAVGEKQDVSKELVLDPVGSWHRLSLCALR